MSSVDNRVVQMEFDNKDFEKKVATTQHTLDELNKDLNSLGKTGLGTNFSNAVNDIADGVDSITSKFSALEYVAKGALEKIGGYVADLAINIADSLIVDPITAGFEKYNSEISATAAIVNAVVGTEKEGLEGVYYTYEDVMGALEKIGWYADSTSYDYTAMINAIQQMVTNGADLESSIPVIMGMGNAFSYAGNTATEMSSSFGTFASAFSKGYLEYRKYTQLVGQHAITSNMKQQFIDAAEAAGILEKKSEDVWVTTALAAKSGQEVAISGMEYSLQYGWLTTDVMSTVFGEQYGDYADSLYEFSKENELLTSSIDKQMKTFDAAVEKEGGTVDTLKKTYFTAAQEAKLIKDAVDGAADAVSSSYKRMLTAILGDYEKARVTMTNLNTWLVEVFANPVLALENLITEWMSTAEGGRSDLLGILTDFFGLRVIDEDTQEIRDYGGVISRVLTPIKEAFSEVFPPVTAERLAEIVLKIREFAKSLMLSEEEMEKVKEIASGFFSVIGVGVKAIGVLIKMIVTALDTFSPLLDMALDIGVWVKKIFDEIFKYFDGLSITNNAIEAVSNAFYDLSTKIKGIFKDFTNEVKPVGDAIMDSIDSLDPLVQAIGDLFKSVGDSINVFCKGIADGFGPTVDKISAGLKQIATDVANCLSYFIHDMIQIPYMEGGGGIQGIIHIVFDAATDAVSAGFLTIGDITGTYFDNLNEEINNKILETRNLVCDFIENVTFKDIIESLKNTAAKIAGAIVGVLDKIFAFFQERFTTEKAEEASEAMYTFGSGVKRFKETLTGSGKFINGLAGIFNIFASINLGKLISGLADAIKGLGSLANNISDIAKAISSGLTEVSNTIKTTRKYINVKIIKQLCICILLLAGAAVALSYANPDNILAAVGSLAGLITVITGAFIAINKFISTKGTLEDTAKNVVNLKQMSSTLIKIGAALILFAVSLSTISKISAERMEQSVEVFTVLLVEMWIFVATMAAINKSKSASFSGISDIGITLLKVASALLILANTMKIVADIPDPEGAFIVVSGLFVLMGAFTALMGKMKNFDSKKLLGLGGSTLMIAFAMTQLVIALMLVGTVGYERLEYGLIVLAAVLAMLVVAFRLTSKCDPKQMLGFAGSVGIVAVSLLSLAIGLAAMSLIPFASLMKAVDALILVLLGLAAAVILIKATHSEGLLLELAAVFASFGVSAFLFAAAIAWIMSSIMLFSTFSGLIEPIIANIKLFLLVGAAELSEALVVAVSALIKAICAAILEAAEDIIYTVCALFDIVIKGIWEFANTDAMLKLTDILYQIAAALWKVLWALVVYLFYAIPEWGKMGWDAIQKAIWPIGEKIRTAISDLWEDIKTYFKNAWTDMKNTLLGKVLSGLVGIVKDICNAIATVFCTLFGINSPSTVFMEFGGYLIEGLKLGLTNGIEKVKDGIMNVCTKIKDTFCKFFKIESPSKLFEQFGEYIDLGLVNGLSDEESSVTKAASGLGDALLDGFDLTSISSGLDVSSLASSLDLSSITGTDATITPVLDLSEIQNGSMDLSSYINSANTDLGSLSVAGDDTTDKLIAEIELLREDLAKLDFSENGIGAEIKAALNGVSVYMDTSKVGSLVTSYQTNTRRAAGL